MFEGAEKHILPIQARIEPGESYFHLRLSARIFNFKILPEPGLGNPVPFDQDRRVNVK